MCQSKAEGGRHCATHTRPRYEAARDALAAVMETPDVDPVARMRAEESYMQAACMYADTPSGARHLTARRDAIKRGEPAGGDHPVALAAALGIDEVMETRLEAWRADLAQSIAEGRSVTAPRPTAERPQQEDEPSALARALRGEQVAREDLHPIRSSDTSGPGVLSREQRMLRGLPAEPQTRPDNDADPRALVEVGGLTVMAGQRAMLQPWGPDVPTQVRLRHDVTAADGSQHQAAVGGYEGSPDRAVDGHQWATITVTNPDTGERVRHRATHETTTGLWTIQHPVVQRRRGR